MTGMRGAALLLVLWLIVSRFKINFYVAKFFAICVVTLWNFLANFFITFNQSLWQR